MTVLRILLAAICLLVWGVFIVVNLRAVLRSMFLGKNDSIVPILGTAIGVIGIALLPWRPWILMGMLTIDAVAYVLAAVIGVARRLRALRHGQPAPSSQVGAGERDAENSSFAGRARSTNGHLDP